MKRLEIIVEGPTEREFVRELLAPYLNLHGIYMVSPIVISTSISARGGHTSYAHLKRDIRGALNSKDTDLVVSMFVDYFRCPDVPYPERWRAIKDHRLQVVEMERCIADDIADWRFIPHIQLHEFESLLFASSDGFREYYDCDEIDALEEIMRQYPNPEDINSSPAGAPSKRLINIRRRYDKILEGNLIAISIGIETILARCPQFRNWVELLIKTCRP